MRVLPFLVLFLVGCGQAPPDQAVYTFFDAMTQGDANRMATVLDSAVFLGHSGASELDTLLPQAGFDERRNRILMELTGGGVKRIWLSDQVIVGRTQLRGDTAWVEVSFVDQETKQHYFTQFGLSQKGKSWRIFRFKRT